MKLALALFTTAGLLDATLFYAGVAVAPDGMNAWVAAQEDNGSLVLHTTDFGSTWQSVELSPHRLVEDIEYVGAGKLWACGEVGYIWFSSDEGLTWTTQSVGGPFSAVRLAFLDTLRGWAAGDNACQLRTTDGGATWENIWLPLLFGNDSVRFQGAALPSQQDVWLVCGRAAEGDTWRLGQGYIAHSTNGGDSWTLNRRDTVYDFFDIAFSDSMHGVVVGGNDTAWLRGVVLYTSDAGATWSPANFPGSAGLLRGVDFADATLGGICGDGGYFLYTTDGGSNWQTPSCWPSPNVLRDIDFGDTLHGMACGDSILYRTTDGGRTWDWLRIGIEESAQYKDARNPALVSVVRGVLFLPASSFIPHPSSVHDVSGRRVLGLHPGANDVSRLAPGVYFVTVDGARDTVYARKALLLK